jgi:hypothetical protein
MSMETHQLGVRAGMSQEWFAVARVFGGNHRDTL